MSTPNFDFVTAEWVESAYSSFELDVASQLKTALESHFASLPAPEPSYVLENPLHEVAEQMEFKGGKFVRALADCLLFADPENKAALLAAFPAIMERYDALATAEAKGGAA